MGLSPSSVVLPVIKKPIRNERWIRRRKFPFHIQQIRTNQSHEFQEKFHWHVKDIGIRHVDIKVMFAIHFQVITLE